MGVNIDVHCDGCGKSIDGGAYCESCFYSKDDEILALREELDSVQTDYVDLKAKYDRLVSGLCDECKAGVYVKEL